MNQSSDITKFFTELLVTKDKVAKIKEYYLNIKDKISSDFDATKARLESDMSWIENQINILNASFSDLLTRVNAFTAKTTTPELIIEHDKYLEMMALYRTYIKTFYDRMNELYELHRENFINASISKVNSQWRFHHSEDRNNSSRIYDEYDGINYNASSQIVEISHSRFLLYNGENTLYDINNRTKECFLVNFDSKTIGNKRNIIQGSYDDIYSGETCYIKAIFTLKGKDNVYVLLDIGHTSHPEVYSQSDIIGTPSDGSTHILVFAKYDIASKTIVFPEDTDNTSKILIRDKVLQDNTFYILDDYYNDFNYIYIDKYVSRIKVDGTSSINKDAKIVLTCNAKISDMKIYQNKYLIVPINKTVLALFDLDIPVNISIPYRTVQTTQLSLSGGDTGTINAIMYIDGGVYFSTDISLWFSDNLFQTIKRDDRLNHIGSSNVTLRDKSVYNIDNNVLYYLHEHTYVFGLKPDMSLVVSPTRYSETLKFINNNNKLVSEGYVNQSDIDYVNGENILFSYIDDNKYVSITNTGKVLVCNIEDGVWEGPKNSVTEGNSCTAFYLDNLSETIYIGTYEGAVYKSSKKDLYENPSAISIIACDDLGSVFSMTTHKDILYIGGYNGRVCAFDLKDDSYHPYNEYLSQYAINSGSAIGNVNVRCMLTVGDNLIVAGNGGKVASCNLATKNWTRYNGINDLTETNDIHSPFYNDGSALGGGDITQVLYYLNKYIIIFGTSGKIASCHVQGGHWTDYQGSPINPIFPGPPIYNDGSSSGGKTIRSALLLDEGILIGSEGGHISSLNPETGGITKYNGVDFNLEIPGTGIFFDGYGFEYNIHNLTLDISRNTVILSGQNCCVSTFDLNERELLSPVISKLYYIGKRNNTHDLLSSVLVQLSKDSLQEHRIFFPPREKKNAYEDMYSANNYTYKNGDIIYKVDVDLRTVRRSSDNGLSYVTLNINNSSWLNPINNFSIKNVKGFVSKNGVLGFRAIVNQAQKFLFVYEEDDSSFSASWFNPTSHGGEDDIIDFYFLQGKYSTHFLFYVRLKDNPASEYSYPSPISINKIDKTVSFQDTFISRKVLEDSSFLPIQNNDNIHLSMDADGALYTTNENSLNIFRWNFNSLGLSPEMVGLPSTVVIDNHGFIPKMLLTRKKSHYLDNDKVYSFLGFYALPQVNFNFIYGAKNGDILILTINVEKDAKIIIDSIGACENDESWNTILNEIYSYEYLDEYSNNKFINNENISISSISYIPKYLSLFNSNIRGILGLDISYWENDVSATSRAGYKEKHLILSLDSEIYGKYINPEYKVYKALNGRGMFIGQSDGDKDVIITSYQIDNEERINTNSIIKLNLVDGIQFTPVRALSDLWYNHSVMMSNDINALRINAKIVQLESENLFNNINKQFTFRYEVCVINETLGQYILYEVEKSTVNSRMDYESKTPGVLLRVKAIDGFEDDVIELFNGRKTERQVAFIKIPTSNQGSSYTNYIPKGVIAEDYSAIIQLGNKNKVICQTQGLLYTIKIRPLTNIPSSIDVQFYIEPFKNKGSPGVSLVTNKIKRSELKTAGVADVDKANADFAFSQPEGFISETIADTPHNVNALKRTNHNLYPQYLSTPSYLRKGFEDTLISFVKGRGHGRYDKLDGIVANAGNNAWTVVPYSYNKKPVLYSIDRNGTKYIKETYDIEFLKNGRNISKMHEFGVYAPNVLNVADYYTDLKDSGRIVKSEGLLLTSYGLFEGIGTIDERQKRITDVTEVNEGSIYRHISHALDTIRNRLYGYAYDFIDRYNTSEIPYYYIRSWWIPAKGYIGRSNESLLTFDYSDTRFTNVGKALFPFNNISPPQSISKPDYENGGGGVGSGDEPQDPNIIAFSTLIDEKFPLTHWDRYRDLDFVRVYKDIYIDGHEEERIEIEGPREIIPRNHYYYEDDLSWDRVGKEILMYMTGYYYRCRDWKIYFYEKRVITSGYALDDSNRVDSGYEFLVTDHNRSIVLSDVIEYTHWFVNEKPVGSEDWPLRGNELVGERIINLVNPLVDGVFHVGSMASWLSNKNNIEQNDASKAFFQMYRRGTLVHEEQNIATSGTHLFDFKEIYKKRDPVLVTHTTDNTFTGDVSNLIDRINHIDSESDMYLTLFTMFNKQEISQELKDEMTKFGINSPLIPPGRTNAISIGSTKILTGAHSISEVPNTYYAKGLGMIVPIRTKQFKYSDLFIDNNSYVWVATIKKYFANCTDSTEVRNMTSELIDKNYDRYAGLGTHQYLYGSTYRVYTELGGVSPRIPSKDFYYYTVEGEGTPTQNIGCKYWWDRRQPSGNPTNAIVERQYIGRIEPTDEDKNVHYIIREWLNDGTFRDIDESYNFYTKWFEINDISVLSIPVADEAGELLDQYTISGVEKYAWYDGTILPVPRTSTFEYLKSDFGLTISIEVTYDSTSTSAYYIRRKITFVGTKVNDGGINTFEKTWSTTATYTTENDSPEGALDSLSTGKRVIRWTT